ncbi:MAG TPA: DNA circularization N-terminal domain-containing protein [Candidatus Faecousia faecavium]|nr:DNA circularization N-terminal domain-containing protein [Candidatus Faecousia faecavium]
MDFLSYKTFVWPQNPHTYEEKMSREPQYSTSDGVTYFEGMGELKRIITGSGVFTGENAFEQFRTLAKLMDSSQPGNLEHPIWGIRYCYFTGLELTQEPKENYVSYKFTFTGALTNGEVPK